MAAARVVAWTSTLVRQYKTGYIYHCIRMIVGNIGYLDVMALLIVMKIVKSCAGKKIFTNQILKDNSTNK